VGEHRRRSSEDRDTVDDVRLCAAPSPPGHLDRCSLRPLFLRRQLRADATIGQLLDGANIRGPLSYA
jgi:hypothetical protein